MLIKKIFFTLILALTFTFSVYSAEVPSLSAGSAVLINADTNEIIYQKNAYKQRSMASTTKIMTAVLAIESGRLQETVTAENMAAEGSSIGLKEGYKMSLEALVWGMLLESGNDAAKLTANFLAGSEESFSLAMNEKAREIGMANTNFVTASGLDDEEHYTTAYDMSLLGSYAIKNPVFREICSAKTKSVKFIEPNISFTFANHNRLLYSCDGVFGIKTGFTKKSGRCLVSACQRGETTLVAVTLNAGDDWNDHIKLYNYGFDNTVTEKAVLNFPESVSIYGGTKSVLYITADLDAYYSYFGNKGSITQKIYLPRLIYAPVNKGDILGRAEILKDGKRVAAVNLIADNTVSAAEPTEITPSLWQRITNRLKEIFS